MTGDQRTELFLPNKRRFKTAGEKGEEVDFGDNWRALEYWSRVRWEKMGTASAPLLNGWFYGNNSNPPSYCIDGFGFVHFRGLVYDNQFADPWFWTLPPAARPFVAEEIPIVASINFLFAPRYMYIGTNGNMQFGGGFATGDDVLCTLSGSFSTVPIQT